MKVEIYSDTTEDFSFILDPICNDNTPTPSETPTQTPTIAIPYSHTHRNLTSSKHTCNYDEELNLNQTDLGVFFIPVNFGEGTGEVRLIQRRYTDRFQIIYQGQIVADSLFVSLQQHFNRVFNKYHQLKI